MTECWWWWLTGTASDRAVTHRPLPHASSSEFPMWFPYQWEFTGEHFLFEFLRCFLQRKYLDIQTESKEHQTLDVHPCLPLSSCVTSGKLPDLHFLTIEWGSKNSVCHIWGCHGNGVRVQCQSTWLSRKHYSNDYPCPWEDLKSVRFKNLFFL